MYIASIVLCLISEPISSDTCETFHHMYRFATEEECWDEVSQAIILNQDYPLIDHTYTILDASCEKEGELI